MIGGLLYYISHAEPNGFQPMKANFGLMPPLERRVRRKKDRNQAYARRALADLRLFINKFGIEPSSSNEVSA
jgi:methylenetetrahydrofolate--tRNA-(uracil-5-)-methyltransferase